MERGREVDDGEESSEKNIGLEDLSFQLAPIRDALNETIAEENARSKESLDLLNSLDINMKSMPKHIQDSWHKTAQILRSVGLSDVDETGLTLAMETKRRETKKRAREERKLKSRYDELCANHGKLWKRRSALEESVDSLEKFIETECTENEEEYTNRVFMATKLNDYRRKQEILDQHLDEIATSDQYPNSILEKYETYMKLIEETSLLDKELKKYGDLPANLSEASLIVAEKEKYLKDLEQTIFEKLRQ